MDVRNCTKHPVTYKLDKGRDGSIVVTFYSADGSTSFERYRRATEVQIRAYADNKIKCEPEWAPCK